MGIRNMAKKRTPVLSDETTMILPTTDMSIKHTMCMLRSLYLPDVYVTTSETKKVPIHTGAVMRRVSVVLYPKVLTIVGKKYWKDCESRLTCCNKVNRYSRGSLRANMTPSLIDEASVSSASPMSSMSLH